MSTVLAISLSRANLIIPFHVFQFSVSLESELESESHDAGIEIRIGIKIFGQHWNRNHLLLESELESESWNLKKPWNRNQNRNQP